METKLKSTRDKLITLINRIAPDNQLTPKQINSYQNLLDYDNSYSSFFEVQKEIEEYFIYRYAFLFLLESNLN